MDRQRHDLHAYEYLCHVGEAQQWIEGCLDEELGFGVTELEEGLVDGVVLAKLAQRLQDEGVVKSIYTVSPISLLSSPFMLILGEGRQTSV
jgi:Ras GTPase-activating-like protein IQGAP2/3